MYFGSVLVLVPGLHIDFDIDFGFGYIELKIPAIDLVMESIAVNSFDMIGTVGQDWSAFGVHQDCIEGLEPACCAPCLVPCPYLRGLYTYLDHNLEGPMVIAVHYYIFDLTVAPAHNQGIHYICYRNPYSLFDYYFGIFDFDIVGSANYFGWKTAEKILAEIDLHLVFVFVASAIFISASSIAGTHPLLFVYL